MSETIRVIVVNADEEAMPELRALLLGVAGVKIVAEIDEPSFLAQALDQFPTEVVLVHLDPNPTAMMDVVAPVIEARKERLAAIAMTEDRDAELVVRAMRAGMKEFLWKPFQPEQFGEILRRVGTEAPTGGRRVGQLIPVFAASGGIGATTLATNLAVELAQLEDWARGGSSGAGRGRPRVAVVDLDLRFGQVAMVLDAQPTYSIADLCQTPEQIDPQLLERAMVKHPTGVHILAQPPDFAQAERISAAQCAGVLAALQEYYDFVVVDGPTRLDPTARAVFDMADVCLLILQLMVPPVRNTDRLLRELARIGYSMDRIRLVCNRLGRESAYLEPTDVETTLGRKLDFVIPDDWKTAATAINMGAPLCQHAPKSKLRAAFQRIALTLANKQTGVPEEATPENAADAPRKHLKSLFGAQKR